MGAPHLHLAHPVARGRRGDDHVRRGDGVDVGQQRALELEILRGALLHEVGRGHRPPPGRARPPGVGARTLSQAELGQRRPGLVDEVPQPRLGVLGGVPRHHAVAAGQEVGDPAAADHPGADTGDGPDLLRGRAARRHRRLQREDLAALVGGGHLGTHALHDGLRPLDQLRVRRLDALAQVEVVLEPDADVSAEQHRLRHPGHLHRAEGERGPHGTLRDLVDHGGERQRVGRSAVRDAHAAAGTSRGRRSAPPRPAGWRTTGVRCRRSPSPPGLRAPGSSWRPRAACRAC